MAKCERCKKRKAKRNCKALNQSICSLCCGQLREKEIHCPSNCVYLAKHQSYQEKKKIEKSSSSVSSLSPGEDILHDERLAWLVFNVQKTIYDYTQSREELTDEKILIALDYAKENIKKEKRIFFAPEEKTGPKNELGETIFQNTENCRFQKRIIVPGGYQKYKKEEKIKCIDRVILEVKNAAQENFEGKNYIQNLIQHFSKFKNSSSEKKLVESF